MKRCIFFLSMFVALQLYAINPTAISISPESTTIGVGSSVTLTTELTPSYATTTYTWGSIMGFGEPYNFDIIPNGKTATVKANAAGTIYIVVETANGCQATCIVTAQSATDITLSRTSLSLQRDDKFKLKATVQPKGSSSITWSSSNTSTAKVATDGTVTAVKKGTATITAKTSNGLSATCIVNVTDMALVYEYTSSGSTAKVVTCDPNYITNGVITIPTSTIHNAKTYKVTSIGEKALYGLDELKELVIAEGVTSIEDYGIADCANLSKVEFPNSVTNIGKYVFDECGDISQPVYNSKLFVYMPEWYYASNYVIPDGISRICYAAFYRNRYVKSVTIPSTVTYIEDHAFNNQYINTVTCLATNPPYYYDWCSISSGVVCEFTESFGPTQYAGTLKVPQGCRSKYIADIRWQRFSKISELNSLPADGTTLTCAEAVQYASQLEHNSPTTQTYTIYGYITSTDGVVSRNQQIFWIADTKSGGEVFEIWWGNVSEQLQVGDYVKCTGHLMRYNDISEMKYPDVTLISRTQTPSQPQTIDYEPDYVEIRYYPQLGFHLLNMYVLSYDNTAQKYKTQQLLRILFYPSEQHKISGFYSSTTGSIEINPSYDGYYTATNNTWYDLDDASFIVDFMQQDADGYNVYQIFGYCDLKDGREIDFSYTNYVFASTAIYENGEWTYSDYTLEDYTTSVDEYIYIDNQPTKILRDGQILIRHGDKTYNLQGIVVE